MQKINSAGILQGYRHPETGVPINVWEHIKKCTGRNCIYAKGGICTYQKAQEEHPPGLCSAEKRYMKLTMENIWPLLEKTNFDSLLMQFFGMHLMPLYHDLCQMKMRKTLIEDGMMVYSDKGGRKHIHPIYEEIRKVHREIVTLWRQTEMIKLAKEAGFLKAITVADPFGKRRKGVGGYADMAGEEVEGDVT